jgi:hypothetical protein
MDKFNILQQYGFSVTKQQVLKTLSKPDRLDQKDTQLFATKVLTSTHALRVVYEKRNMHIIVITFYPVRRDRYEI